MKNGPLNFALEKKIRNFFWFIFQCEMDHDRKRLIFFLLNEIDYIKVKINPGIKRYGYVVESHNHIGLRFKESAQPS